MATESSQKKLAIISPFPVAKVVVPVGTLTHTHTVVSHLDALLVRQAGPSKHQVSLKLEVRGESRNLSIEILVVGIWLDQPSTS